MWIGDMLLFSVASHPRYLSNIYILLKISLMAWNHNSAISVATCLTAMLVTLPSKC